MNNEFLNKKLGHLIDATTEIIKSDRNYFKGQVVNFRGNNFTVLQEVRKGVDLLLTEDGQAISLDSGVDQGKVISSRTLISRHRSPRQRQRANPFLVQGATIYSLITENEKVEFWIKTLEFEKKIAEIDQYIVEEFDEDFPFIPNENIYLESNPNLSDCLSSLSPNWKLAYPPGPGSWRYIVSVAGVGAIGATTVFTNETGVSRITSVAGVVDSRLATFGTFGTGQGGGAVNAAGTAGSYRATENGISSELRNRFPDTCVRVMLKSSNFPGASAPVFGWFPEPPDGRTVNPYEACDPSRRPVITPLPVPTSGEGTYQHKNRYEVFLYKYSRENYFVTIKNLYDWRTGIFDQVKYFLVAKDSLRELEVLEGTLGWREEALTNKPAYEAIDDEICLQDYLTNTDSYIFDRDRFLFEINRDDEVYKIEEAFISSIVVETEPNPELTSAVEIPFDDIYCDAQASAQFNPQDLTDPLIYTTVLTISLPIEFDEGKLLDKGLIKIIDSNVSFQFNEFLLESATQIKVKIKGRIFRQNEGDPNFYYRNSADTNPISLPLSVDLIYTVENWLSTREEKLPISVIKMKLKSEENECVLREKEVFDIELPSPGKGKIEVVLAYKK